MDMSLLAVLVSLLGLVAVAMRQLGVVVLVTVPVCAMLRSTRQTSSVVMRVGVARAAAARDPLLNRSPQVGGRLMASMGQSRMSVYRVVLGSLGTLLDHGNRSPLLLMPRGSLSTFRCLASEIVNSHEV
jgi:hypothetical protein